MASQCFSPIKARVARLVRLDACGNPVIGASSVVTTDGFVQVQASSQYEDGEEFIVKNANGGLCVNEKDPNSLKRVELTIDFCQVDPDAVNIITGERLLSCGAPASGSGIAFGEGLLLNRFSLELWQPIAGQSCTDGVEQFVYWAFPNVGNPKIGDLTFENGPLTFQTIGDTKAAGPDWEDGPGSGTSWLCGANEILTDEHFAFIVTSTPPPTPSCGATALA